MCRESEGVTWVVVQSQVAPFCLGDVDGEDQYTKFLLYVRLKGGSETNYPFNR